MPCHGRVRTDPLDLALPGDANLADLLPTLLRHAGEDPDGEGYLSGGWVLQRAGEAPLDAGRRLTALGVRDGDILHLRHRDSALPELAVDDVAEAVAGVRGVPWTTARTRAAAVGAAGVLGLLAVVVLGFAGPPWPVPAAMLCSLTLVCTGAAVALSHSFAAPCAAVVSTVVAAQPVSPACRARGWTERSRRHGSTRAARGRLGRPGGVGGRRSRRGVRPLCLLFGGARRGCRRRRRRCHDAGSAAARTVVGVTVAGLMGLAPVLPGLAARMARLPLPPVPVSAADLRQAEDLLPGADVRDRARAADQCSPP